MFATLRPTRVAALGSSSPLAQVSRIREGLAALPGVEVVEDLTTADLIYANDEGSHGAALLARDGGAPGKMGKVILNVLDVPEAIMPPNGDYTIEKLAALGAALSRADSVTTISPFVQSQLIRCLGIGSTVIYNPIKDVSPAQRLAGERPYPQFRALMAGRVNDPNKRVGTIGIPALIAAGFTEAEVAVIGGEWPGWGTAMGVVSNATLNDLYNSVDYVIYPSRLEGLGLPPLEGMVCGAIPIVCFDLSTFHDFPYPQHWGCYPSVASVFLRLRVLIDNPHILEHDRQYALGVGEGLAEDLGKDAVARRIMGVYQRLVEASTSSSSS